jgi:DNA-binding NarL/FixJ family response regulator
MRTLIADDQANVRSALALLLEEEPQFEIVGEAADAVGLLRAVRKHTPITSRPIFLHHWR